MSALWQTVIPAALTALVAGRVAWTRTSRLQRTIATNLDLDLLGRLSADHPNRAALEAHNGELLGLLVRRQQRRFGPFTQAGVSFGAFAGLAGVALVMAGGTVLIAAGVVPSTPSDPATPGGTSGPQRRSSSSARPVSSWLRSGPPVGSSGSIRHRFSN
jgi:hypothetical protein